MIFNRENKSLIDYLIIFIFSIIILLLKYKHYTFVFQYMEDKLDRIKSIVCDIAGITEKQFVGHCRRPNITNARHIFIGILDAQTPQIVGSNEAIYDVYSRKADVLKKHISELKEPYKTVIEMREIDRMAYKDIADLLGKNLSTIKSQIRNGRHILMEQSKKEFLEIDEMYLQKIKNFNNWFIKEK